MRIRINRKTVCSIARNNRAILAVYINNELVWPEVSPVEEILSCFARGYWIDEYPWTDDLSWTD